ncbi:unnamed protein product [Closterium sp. NIES-65]|nr:unnamed protein product [Closterium sp. NIES-65]
MKQLLSNWRLETGAAKHGAEGGEKGEVGEQGGAEGEEGEAEDRMMERGKGVEGEAAAEQGGAEGEEGEAEDRMNKREKGVEGGASGVEGAAEIVERVNLAAGLEVEEGAKEWDEEEEGVPQPALCHLSTLASLPLTGYCTEEEGGRGGAHINGFPAASQRAAIPNASGARSGAAASHRSASFGGQPPPSMMPGGGVPVPIADAQTPHLGSPASVGHVPGGSSRNPPGSGNLARPGVSSGHGYGSCGGMHQPTPSPGHAAAYSGHSNHELGAIPNGIGGRISGGARAAASAPASPASMGRAPVAHGPSVSHPLNQSASAGSRRPLAAPRPGLGIPLNPGPRPVASVAEQAAMNKTRTEEEGRRGRGEMHRGVGKEAVVCVSLHAACIGFDSYPATPLILSSVSVLISLPLAGNAQRWREGEAEEMHESRWREWLRCVWASMLHLLRLVLSHPSSLCPYPPSTVRKLPVVISPGGHVRAQMLQRLLSPSRDDTREQTLVHAAAVTVTTGTTAFDTCSIAAAGEGLQSLPSHVSACVAMLAALGARNCNASLRSATTGANTCAVSRKRSWEQAVMPMQSRQGAEGAIDGQLITSEVSRKRSLSQDSSTGVEGVLDGQLKALLLEMEEEERRAVQAPLAGSNAEVAKDLLTRYGGEYLGTSAESNAEVAKDLLTRYGGEYLGTSAGSNAEVAKDLLTRYGGAYLGTSIALSLVSFSLCYLLVDQGVDVAGLLDSFGLHVDSTGEAVGTFAIAYAAHKALSPVRFPPTVALTPVVAGWLGKNKEKEEEGSKGE